MERREFGIRVRGRTYAVRPGAYAVLLDGAKRVAVVRTEAGCFLPGGGIDPGESAEDAAVREVREETGYDVRLVCGLGEADELVLDHHAGFLIKRGAFFLARSGDEAAGAGEDDHTLLWLDPDVAIEKLRHESHAWAVKAALRSSG